MPEGRPVDVERIVDENERPDTDAGILRAVAKWLDLADWYLALLFKNPKLDISDEDRQRVLAFMGGKDMQHDLLRIADTLEGTTHG